MKSMNNIKETDNLLVISSYPSRNKKYKNMTGGIAWHTQKTLKWMKKAMPELNVKVIANIFNKPEVYVDDDGINVQRKWKINSLNGLFSIAKEIVKSKSNKILFPFEFFIVGSLIYLPIYIGLIYLSKIVGKDVTLIFHNVVSDIGVFEHNKAKAFIFNNLRSAFYNLIMFPCENVIVFEQSMKEHLGDSDKISVIALAVEPKKIIDKSIAKKKLGLDANKKYLLYFGFLSLYKGIDDLLQIWDKNTGYELIIAGGENPAYASDAFYQEFIEKIKKVAKEKGAIMTGFVPDDMVDYYYNACESVILPYKTFMSSSGPLSLAFSYNKPVLLSNVLSEYFKSNDIRCSLLDSGLKKEDVIFDINSKDFRSKLVRLELNTEKYVAFSKSVFVKRQWESLSLDYCAIIFNQYAKLKLVNVELKPLVVTVS